MVGKFETNSNRAGLGYIDKTGKEVVPLNLDYAGDFSDGAAIIGKNNKWGIILASQLSTIKDKNVAAPTSSKTIIDGKYIAFEAYSIEGSNYFKLRDIAMVLNGSQKQFDIAWDGSKNAIVIATGKSYKPAGGEINVSGKMTSKDDVVNTSSVYINVSEVKLQAYSIDGFNYFKLRDLGQAINFSVVWDAKANAIVIDSTSGYKGF